MITAKMLNSLLMKLTHVDFTLDDHFDPIITGLHSGLKFTIMCSKDHPKLHVQCPAVSTFLSQEIPIESFTKEEREPFMEYLRERLRFEVDAYFAKEFQQSVT